MGEKDIGERLVLGFLGVELVEEKGFGSRE